MEGINQGDGDEQSNERISSFLIEHEVAPNLRENKAGYLKWHTLNLIHKGSSCEITYFGNYIAPWISTDADPEQSWKKLANELAIYNVNMADLILNLCTLAFEKSKTDLMYQLLENISSRAHIPSIMFQTAFMAYNTSSPQKCINLLKRMPKHTSQTLTLMAQAYQDLKDFDLAHTHLYEATEQNTNDLMAWFQLAKNDLACNKLTSAWGAIKICEQLKKNNPEIVYLKLMIGLAHYSGNTSRQDLSKNLFLESLVFFEKNLLNFELFKNLAELSLKFGSESWYVSLCQRTDFTKFVDAAGIYNYTASTLRKLNTLRWHNASIIFNDKILGLISCSEFRKQRLEEK